ncbi:MAG: hypothetical protein QCI00_09660 [Candidatus Thermoplasmatota archaeon]|nr:hypothetical protein [Candidatus Thermoplasmatota archaeon]
MAEHRPKNWRRFVAEAEDCIFSTPDKPLTEEDHKKANEIWKMMNGKK